MDQTIKIVTSTGNIEVNFFVTSESPAIQHVVISQNGHTIAHETSPLESFAGVYFYSLHIWRRYEIVHRGNFITRSGFGLCGCYNEYQPDASPNYHRPESDTEHASGCVELLRSCEAYYPELLSPELYRRAEHLLKDHDLGENEYGDQPDDGSQNLTEKNRSELINFVLDVAHLPATTRATAISDFISFQYPSSPHNPTEIARLAQLAKVIDKLETILSGAYYEKFGSAGNLAHKQKYYSPLTAQDQYYIKECDQDSSILASWLAHAVHGYHTYYGFPYVFDIVKAAVIDIRGTWFPWFEDFCQRHHIPQEHVVHPFLSRKNLG